ncbi:MAG: GNAT family N-acetyltransferase [Woeseiaceae bacterium]
MKLRLAQPDDLPVLLEFEQGVIREERPFCDSIKPSGVTYYDLPDLMTNSNASLQVVEHDGRIVGCGYVKLRPSISAYVHEQNAYLGFMYVEPEFRRQGINRLILDSLISWSKERDIHDIYLDVYAENKAALGAYEKAGFVSEMIEMKLS